MPLIIRDPRREARRRGARVVEAFTEAIDVMPTIIDWIGGDVPRAMDGRSLLPFLRRQTAGALAERGLLRARLPRCGRRSGRRRRSAYPPTNAATPSSATTTYKYVHFAALPPLLFDMRDDPHETTNLAEAPAMQGVVLRYAQAALTGG